MIHAIQCHLILHDLFNEKCSNIKNCEFEWDDESFESTGSLIVEFYCFDAWKASIRH